MNANPHPQAPQSALEGGVRSGRCGDTPEACSAQNPALSSMFGEPVDWWVAERLADIAAWDAKCRRDRYRAALARGVWWG